MPNEARILGTWSNLNTGKLELRIAHYRPEDVSERYLPVEKVERDRKNTEANEIGIPLGIGTSVRVVPSHSWLGCPVPGGLAAKTALPNAREMMAADVINDCFHNPFAVVVANNRTSIVTELLLFVEWARGY